jgi:sensor domain CHASE-containing protein
MSSFARKIIIFLLVFVALLLTAATFAINVQDSDTSLQDSTLRSLRLHTIQTLITSGFDRFVTMPLGPGSDFFHLT